MMTPDDTHEGGTPIFDADNFGSALEFTHHVTVATVTCPADTKRKVSEKAHLWLTPPTALR